MVYNAKEEILKAKFLYGYQNSFEISQDSSTMNRDARLNHTLNKYFLNTSLTKTCQPLCLDDNKNDRMPTMDYRKYSLFSSQDISQSKISHIFLLLAEYSTKNERMQENRQVYFIHEIMFKTLPTQRFRNFWRICGNHSF